MGDVRRSNLSLVLGAIAGAPRGAFPTRAQVAGATGLTKASVSSMVTDLLDAGLVREVGLNARGERGRPGVGLDLNTKRAVMGMEVNVDYIAAGVMDLSGTVLFLEVRERDNRGSQPEPVLEALAVLAAKARGDAGEARRRNPRRRPRRSRAGATRRDGSPDRPQPGVDRRRP